ncbi:MAG: DUF2250 domain-containing protein [Natronomonas sp.]
MSHSTTPTHPVDEQILRYLADSPPDYAPLIATRLGLHLGYVEDRLDAMCRQGLVEAISEEVVYTTTDRGRAVVAADDETDRPEPAAW